MNQTDAERTIAFLANELRKAGEVIAQQNHILAAQREQLKNADARAQDPGEPGTTKQQ